MRVKLTQGVYVHLQGNTMTITEIAKQAGVSIGTVDRVIHNRGRVSPVTREKIERLIAEYGYKPNPLAQHLKNNKEYTIGVLIPLLHSENAYWQSLFEGIEKAEKELAAFSVRIIYYEFDRTIQGSCLKAGYKLLENTIDALIVAPVVPDEVYEILNKAGSIPYVFIDSPLPHAKPLVTVAQNPFKAGYCAARVMNVLKPSGRNFVCVQMHQSAYNLTERSRGFSAFFARNPNSEVHQKIWTWSGNNQEFYDYMDSIFLEIPSIDGIFIPNDSVYKLSEYLEIKKIKKDFAIIGFDLQKNNVQCLLNGSIDMLISQQQSFQGYRAVQEIYKSILLKQTIENAIDINIEIYFKENLPEFIMG